MVANQAYVYAALEGELQYFDGQPESDSSDNVAAVAETLTVPGVTLAVSNTHAASSSLVVGQSVNVSFVVTNQGTETAQNSWEDAVYVSANSTFDSSATEIAFFASRSPLTAQNSYMQSGNATIPQYLSPGQYYLFFVANENRAQAETSYAGDVSAPLAITVNAPDLVIAVNNPPTAVEAGQQLSVSYTVTDSSPYNTTSSYWFDYAYISTDPTLDYTAQYLSYNEYVNSPALAAGQSYTKEQNFTVPTSVVAGQQYYLLFFANQYQYQGVSNPADGLEAVPITILASGVDLQVAANSVSIASLVVPSIGRRSRWIGPSKTPATRRRTARGTITSTFPAAALSTTRPLWWGRRRAGRGAAPCGGCQLHSIGHNHASAGHRRRQLLYLRCGQRQRRPGRIDDRRQCLGGNPNRVGDAGPGSEQCDGAPDGRLGFYRIAFLDRSERRRGGSHRSVVRRRLCLQQPADQFSAQFLGEFYEAQSLAAGGQYSDTEGVSLTGVSNPITGPAYFLVVPNYEGNLNETGAANNFGASDQFALSRRRFRSAGPPRRWRPWRAPASQFPGR